MLGIVGHRKSAAVEEADMDHDGAPVVIVTGGARGIGAELCRALAERGKQVVVADILPAADDVAAGLRDRGLSAQHRHVDVTDEESTDQLAAYCVERFGRIDAMVNNAGIYQDLGRKRSFTELTVAEWERVLRVNVIGLWLATRSVFPVMREQNHGRIVNMASSTVHKGVTGFPHYVASKGAVVALTRSLAMEVGSSGVTVNAIAPGLVHNESSQALNADSYFATAAEQRAVPRSMLPADLVGAVSFLISPDSAFVTGQTIVVDGGAVFS